MNALKKVTPRCIKQVVRTLRNKRDLTSNSKLKRTLAQARLHKREGKDCGFETTIDSVDYSFPDSGSFEYLVREFIVKETLAFESTTNHPVILDCGANIGISTRFFAQLHPSATVTAFEPDPDLFHYLQRNCTNLENVKLVNAAVWSEQTTLQFRRAGILGSHLSHLPGTESQSQDFDVDAIRLADYLGERVDLLKIDIEGAEFAVLEDCQDRLHNVQNLFVEAHTFPDQPQLLASLFSIIEESGFRIHLHSSMDEAQPFMGIPVNNGKDLRVNLFCFRP